MYHCTTDGMGEGKKQKHKHETETPDCGGNMIAKTLQLVVGNQNYDCKKNKTQSTKQKHQLVKDMLLLKKQ